MPGIRMIPYLQEGCRYHTRLPKYEIRRVKWGVTDKTKVENVEKLLILTYLPTDLQSVGHPK